MHSFSSYCRLHFTQIAVALLITSFIGSSTPTLTVDAQDFPILGPCSRFSDYYTFLNFDSSDIEDWPDIYHERVDRIIEEFFEPTELLCEGQSYAQLLQPGAELVNLAFSLPPWQPIGELGKLKKTDIGLVLLEYLRVYECALKEYKVFLPLDITFDEVPGGTPLTIVDFFFSDLVSEMYLRTKLINEELNISRPTLTRTLNIIGAYSRLLPLEAELECVQRASLDIRNLTALSAEASACLPRIWNARDVLRDIEE